MDFRLVKDTELAELPARLNAALPEGVEVSECYELKRKAAELKYLEIGGEWLYDARHADGMAQALTAFFAADEIVITKRSKRGVGESDIRPAIKELRFTPAEGCVRLHAVLSAQEPTLNPELLCEALRQKAAELAPDFARFERIETYDADMNVFR